MYQNKDIIFAEALDCYVEAVYDTALRSVTFLKSREKLKERITSKAGLELEQYLRGERREFTCATDISHLSPFQQKVLNEAEKIEYGETVTYSELARRIGSRAVRAVGGALAINPIPIVIPCHRVVAKSGIGGFSAGIDVKRRLLELECSFQ